MQPTPEEGNHYFTPNCREAKANSLNGKEQRFETKSVKQFTIPREFKFATTSRVLKSTENKREKV
jgi:hypothetical protein